MFHRRMILAAAAILFVAASSEAQTRKLVLIDGIDDGFVNTVEGYERDSGDPMMDQFEIGGNMTDHLAALIHGDVLVIIAHGDNPGGTTNFSWGGVLYEGFGSGPNQMPVPPGFDNLQNVTVFFSACYSARDPDGAGPNKSQVDSLIDAMGGTANHHVGNGFNDKARVDTLPLLRHGGGTAAVVTAAAACLQSNDSWLDHPPINRPGAAVTQKSAAQAIVDSCPGVGGAGVLTILQFGSDYRAPYNAPPPAPDPGSGTCGCSLAGCGCVCWSFEGVTTAYCTAKVNSLGCLPVITSTQVPSASAGSGFVVYCSQVRNNKKGLLCYSIDGPAAIPFQGGILCLNPPLHRTPVVDAGGSYHPANDCSGVWEIDMNAFAAGTAGGLPIPIPELRVPGTKVNCQWWGRDPGFAPPNNTSLSDALEYIIGP